MPQYWKCSPRESLLPSRTRRRARCSAAVQSRSARSVSGCEILSIPRSQRRIGLHQKAGNDLCSIGALRYYHRTCVGATTYAAVGAFGVTRLINRLKSALSSPKPARLLFLVTTTRLLAIIPSPCVVASPL